MLQARRRAVILHGRPDVDEYFSQEFPSQSNSHWLPWLQKQLLVRGYEAQTPEVADSYQPSYGRWSAELERNLTDQPMTLVGHSCGGGFLIRWLSEHPDFQVDTLALVAPWLDPDRVSTTDFFDFVIDDSLPKRVERFHLFHSRDDQESIQKSVSILREHYPDMIQHLYDDMGHFCYSNMGTEEFPDLLSAIAPGS
jgi:uncharacterized protein